MSRRAPRARGRQPAQLVLPLPVNGGLSPQSPAEHGRLRAVDVAHTRLVVVGLCFLLAFCGVVGRLVDLAAGSDPNLGLALANSATWEAARGDIMDRNGVLLATSLPTRSLYADPRDVIDPEHTADRLVALFPELNRSQLLARLTHDGRFAWIKRHLTPREQHAVNRLGLPGIGFRDDQRRVYPQGVVAAHVLGFTDIDSRGLAGVERHFDASLGDGEALRLCLDVRIQQIVREELLAAVREYRAIGGAGLVLDVVTGEVVAMVSLPDFDPNHRGRSDDDTRFNRVTQGVYEMGSTMKLITAAMALDSGAITLTGGYDASQPIRRGGHTIRDYRPQNRWLSLPEILVHSSNIASAHMALDVGGAVQRMYLNQLGMLSPLALELSEVGAPLVPGQWRDINIMTIGFGHGIAVSPLHLAQAVAVIANGGTFMPATIVDRGDRLPEPKPVLSAETSRTMRALMRLNVIMGTGRRADADGLRLGGKTGTAEKIVGGRYMRNARMSSFIGVFPVDSPRYVVLAILDEPQGNRSTHFYATGGWVAAPVVRRIAERIAPVLGVRPVDPADVPRVTGPDGPDRRRHLLLASLRTAIADTEGWRGAPR
ncbi:MAG: penicillin-binding protein 2 [Rhodospirillales bacterium]|nr:MAG: penicillin-binding protein 2 [Rhodospirillales bacterium]